MTKFRELPAAKFGRFGEQLAVKLLRQLGAGVVASFKFSGENDNEAPSMEFHDRRVVIPDADASMRGRRFWLELKTYKEPQRNRTYRCLVHGVPMRLYDEYCESEKQSGTPVYLGVLEVDSGSLLVSQLPISQIEPRYPCLCGCENEPARCEYRTKWGSSYPQWYFRRDCFTEWHQLKGAELKALQAEHARVSHAIRRHGPTREPRRPSVFGPADSPKCTGWVWTCLPCDSTWIGEASAHQCRWAADWRRDFWIQKLRWPLRNLTTEQIAALVAKPIARTRLAELLGERWLSSGDVK